MDSVLLCFIFALFLFALMVITMFVSIFTLARLRKCACPLLSP